MPLPSDKKQAARCHNPDHNMNLRYSENLKTRNTNWVYKYHKSGYYPSYCLLIETRHFEDWNLSPPSDGTYSAGPNRYSFYLLGPNENVATEDGSRIQSQKRRVLNKRQDDG
jgi:hypothetical protein